MSDYAAPKDFEILLRRALAPVEPPPDLRERLEETLTNLTVLAAEELEGWEMRTMKDPRNWVRPAAAAAVGGAAGAALIVLRVRSQHQRRRAVSKSPLDLAQRTARAFREETRRLLEG
jgi:hypothetical protein